MSTRKWQIIMAPGDLHEGSLPECLLDPWRQVHRLEWAPGRLSVQMIPTSCRAVPRALETHLWDVGHRS